MTNEKHQAVTLAIRYCIQNKLEVLTRTADTQKHLKEAYNLNPQEIDTVLSLFGLYQGSKESGRPIC